MGHVGFFRQLQRVQEAFYIKLRHLRKQKIRDKYKLRGNGKQIYRSISLKDEIIRQIPLNSCI